MNIDPEAAAEAYRRRVLDQLDQRTTDAERLKVREQLSGACTTEIAAFEARTPPAILMPMRRPVSRWNSRAASIMQSAAGRLAPAPILPVEVLMKSAPAAIASIDACRMRS